MARYLNRSYWENRTEQQTNKPVQYNYAPTNVYLIFNIYKFIINLSSNIVLIICVCYLLNNLDEHYSVAKHCN